MIILSNYILHVILITIDIFLIEYSISSFNECKIVFNKTKYSLMILFFNYMLI